MRIDRDGDEVSMVLSKQDMIDLKAMFDSHLLIPKYSMFGKSSGNPYTTSSSAYNKSFWRGIKYQQSSYPQPGQWQVVSGNPAQAMLPLPEPKVEDTHEILGKLIRAFDLILENKNTGGKEIE